MQILSVKDYCIPLSAIYSFDDSLSFKKYQIITPEGLNLFSENIFSNFKDAKINNYSNIVLSDNVLLNDVIQVNANPIEAVDTFSTTLALYAYNGIDNNTKFVTFDKCTGQYYYSKVNDAIDANTTYFTVTLLNSLCATVTHQYNNILYYLSYSPTASALELTQNSPYTFRYQLDKNSNCLSLFVILSSKTYIVSDIADRLTITPIQSGANIFFNSSTYFSVNYYKNNLTPDLNTTWVSYDVTDRNSLKANPDKSKLNLTNNILFTSQYSYITDNSIDYNFLLLKNQFTHKNYSYRSDNVNHELNEETPQVENRFYSNVFTGNQQELGDSNITLNYECYNTDYLFKADQYNIFNTTPSLYPYEQLNINDTLWSKAGAIGGEAPYYSDKIFTKRDQSAYTYNDGQYLCTWLFTENANTPGVWVDRYYNPAMVSYISALTAGTIEPSDTYNNPVLSAITSELPFTFVDKKSDLVFAPDTEYIYHRIGEKYVDEIVAALSQRIIQDGLDLTTAKGTEIIIEGNLDEKIYTLNNNAYALITNYNELNDNSQFTVSFWLGADNWQKEFGHQIVGNLTDRGFGIMYDQLITPFVTVPVLTGVYIYNTNFDLIDTVRFQSTEFAPSSETIAPNDYTTVTYTTAYFVKTLHRTDHLSPAGAIVIPKILTCQTNLPPPTKCNCGVLLTETFDYINTETGLNLLIEPCGLSTVPCVSGLTVYSAVTTLCASGFTNVLIFETTTSTSVSADSSNNCIVDSQTPECGIQYCSNDIQIVLNYTACGTTTTTTTIAPTTPTPSTTPSNSTPTNPIIPDITTSTTTPIPNTTPQIQPPPGCTPPVNDMFVNAINYGNTSFFALTSNTQCSTVELGESVSGGLDGSIWFRFQPAINASTGWLQYTFKNIDGLNTSFTIYSSTDNIISNLIPIVSVTGLQNPKYTSFDTTSATPPTNFYVRIATDQSPPIQSRVEWGIIW